MYREYDINLLYRFIGLLLFLLTIAFIDNMYILTALFFIAILLNKRGNPLLSLISVITLLFLVMKYNDPSVSVVNVMLIISYMLIFFLKITKDEFLIFKNMFLDRKYTYRELSKEYYDELKDNNIEQFKKFKSDNKLEDNDDLLEIEDRIVNKTNNDVFNKLTVNYLRFYKNQNDNNKNFGINKETIIYLSVHVVVLILVMVI